MIQAQNIIALSKDAVRRSGDAIKEFPKEVITAEEIVRRRIQSFLRIGLTTAFIWLSGMISIGATAIAQAATKAPTAKSKPAPRHRNHYKSFKHKNDPNLSMTGTASWYGHKFHNRKTASGKRFDQNALMAAHRTLPFGTLLKVTNTANNKSCIVEVTDRGPYAKHRIIDVSQGAAKELGFANEGTAHVTLEVITSENIAYLHSNLRKALPLSDVFQTPAIALQTTSANN